MRAIVAGGLSLALSSCATVPSAPAFPRDLSGLGTEPFWSFSVSGRRVVFQDANEAEPRIGTAERAAGGSRLAFKGTLNRAAFSAVFTQEPCSDGMSDRTYPYRLELVIAGIARHGCGYRSVPQN